MAARHSAISIAHAFQQLCTLSSALTSHLIRASGSHWSTQTTLGKGGGGGGDQAGGRRRPSAAPTPTAAVVRCGN